MRLILWLIFGGIGLLLLTLLIGTVAPSTNPTPMLVVAVFLVAAGLVLTTVRAARTPGLEKQYRPGKLRKEWREEQRRKAEGEAEGRSGRPAAR